jgi:hypothetical protein
MDIWKLKMCYMSIWLQLGVTWISYIPILTPPQNAHIDCKNDPEKNPTA